MSKFCIRCQQFDVRALLLASEATVSKIKSLHGGTWHDELSHWFQLHPNLKALKESATQCNLCGTIYRAYVSDRGRSKLELPAHVQIDKRSIENDQANGSILLGTTAWEAGTNSLQSFPYLRAILYREHATSLEDIVQFEVCAEWGREPMDDVHLLTRLQSGTANNELCFSLARDWLHNCLRHHEQCTPVIPSGSDFPTRVLLVLPPECGPDDTHIRLIDSADRMDEQWAALSYCWGSENPFTLNDESEAELRRGILTCRLPATLRDAVLVTQQLGIKHLWIDALCIKQDSPDDWSREAGRMREVYSGATITIEAAAAASSTDGFLKVRPSSMPYCELPWIVNGETQASVYLRPTWEMEPRQLTASRIWTRGWTLQERLLALRTLSFGERQMSFECVCGVVDEAGRGLVTHDLTGRWEERKHVFHQLRKDRSFLKGLSRMLWNNSRLSLPMPMLERFLLLRQPLARLSPSGHIKGTWYDVWRAIVTTFSKRTLSFPKDRLPALSGIAGEFQKTVQDPYLGGLWQAELWLDLAWEVELLYGPESRLRDAPTRETAYGDGHRDAVRHIEYTAPSWSWASVHGVIKFPKRPSRPYRNFVSLVQIFAVHVIPQAASPLGAVVDGYLDLVGETARYSDPTGDCASDDPLHALHGLIKRMHIHCHSDEMHEFQQKHRPHEGQTFALLKLLTQTNYVEPPIYLLLLESCPDTNCWRRITCLQTFDTKAVEAVSWTKQILRLV